MMLVCKEVNNIKCKHFYCCYHLILMAVMVPKTRKMQPHCSRALIEMRLNF